MTQSEDATIRAALEGPRFALIGVGQLCRMALDFWPQTVPQPEFLLDGIKTGSLDALPIRDLNGHTAEPGVTYLLSAFKMSAPEAKNIFDAIGQPQILTVYDLLNAHGPEIFSNGWRDLSPAPSTRARLDAARSAFTEPQSLAVFDSVADWRFERRLRLNHPMIREEERYDLRPFGQDGAFYDAVYDGGAFNLGLLRRLRETGTRFAEYHGFEPDPANHAACTALARTDFHDVPVRIEKRALMDREGTFSFLANKRFAARIVNDDGHDRGDVIDVEATTLSSYAEDVSPAGGPHRRALVKLHIEGSEIPALHGAAALIETTRVDIFIDLSHDKASLLDIPAWLAGTGRYDLFLRSHALFGEGLTLFARHRP